MDAAVDHGKWAFYTASAASISKLDGRLVKNVGSNGFRREIICEDKVLFNILTVSVKIL